MALHEQLLHSQKERMCCPVNAGHCSNVSCLLQKGKGKAAAAAASSTQPQLASQNASSSAAGSDPDSEASPLAKDIVVTTELLISFNAHSDTWEALEVSIS